MSRIIFPSHFPLSATFTLARSNLDLILRQIEESLFNLWSAVMKRERVLPVNAVTGLAEGGEGGIGRSRENRWMSKAGFNQKRGAQDRPPPPKSPWPAASHAPRVCADKQFHKNRSPKSLSTFPLFFHPLLEHESCRYGRLWVKHYWQFWSLSNKQLAEDVREKRSVCGEGKNLE